jgi:hypothetical protein
MSDGRVGNGNKSSSNYVRAFLRVWGLRFSFAFEIT